MTEDQIKIVSIALNNMKLDELTKIDAANGSSDTKTLRDTGEVNEKTTGLYVPFVSINGYSINKFMTRFYLDLSGFIPTVRFSFVAMESVFISVNYPKDGDIASVYMSSPGGFYKPFRMDFNVLNVVSEPSSRSAEAGKDPEGKGINLKFTITAECRIPGLYTQRSKSFRNMSSYDCLLSVSQDLNLGFSSNEKTLDDVMTWICPAYSYYDFIQEVAIRSFKDDQTSFFDCWIDPYYNLNFVNMGSQFSYSNTPGQTAVFIPGDTDGGMQVSNSIPGTPDQEPKEMTLVLTNLKGYGLVPYFIIGYTLTSRSGNNVNAMGYVTNIGFYDENAKVNDPGNKYVHYDIEAQTPETIKDGMILQKGRARDNSYLDESRNEWLGVLNAKISEADGVHNNFLHAKFQNLVNINDVTKMTLEVELGSYFPGIYRGQVIPVSIYVTEDTNRQKNTGDLPNHEINSTMQPTLDIFLSGNYVVLGIAVYWSISGGRMRQSLTLGKRAWTANSSGHLPKAFPISIQKKDF